ncbi:MULTISPECIES: hypothetical protein [Bacteroides]|uniref:hypothetical protein n=1 Tax=Bacteroides TaxID=816 RepID=UPI002166199D|nr:hypothetical protein [Bacteroides ovatus]MCS2378878.1 hypothetical protein [Bacteroides ovatus]
MEAILAIIITAILFCFFIRKGKNEISEQTTEDVIDSAYTEAYKLVIKQKKRRKRSRPYIRIKRT